MHTYADCSHRSDFASQAEHDCDCPAMDVTCTLCHPEPCVDPGHAAVSFRPDESDWRRYEDVVHDCLPGGPCHC